MLNVYRNNLFWVGEYHVFSIFSLLYDWVHDVMCIKPVISYNKIKSSISLS